MQTPSTTNQGPPPRKLSRAEIPAPDHRTDSKEQTAAIQDLKEAMDQVKRLNREIQSIMAALRGLNNAIQEIIILKRVQRSMKLVAQEQFT
jgi:hypothetical protein